MMRSACCVVVGSLLSVCGARAQEAPPPEPAPVETDGARAAEPSEATVRLVRALDAYLQAAALLVVGAGDELGRDAEGARADWAGLLSELGVGGDDAGRLLDDLADPAVPVADAERALAAVFPAGDAVGVWLERVPARTGDGSPALIPAVLAAPRGDADADDIVMARSLGVLRGDAAFESVRGRFRTRTFGEWAIGELRVAHVFGERTVVDLDALDAWTARARRRLAELTGPGLPPEWSPVRLRAQPLAPIANLRGIVLAQHLLGAESLRRLHADPVVALARSTGGAAQELAADLEAASRLDVVSRGGVIGTLALADVLTSRWGASVLRGDTADVDPDDAGDLAMVALVTAASFAYDDDPADGREREANDDTRAVFRLIDAIAGARSGLTLGAVAAEARDRMARAGAFTVALGLGRRGDDADRAALLRLIDEGLRGNPQDTFMMERYLKLARDAAPDLDTSAHFERAIDGFLARRTAFADSAWPFAQLASEYARIKLRRTETHEAAALAAMALTVAPRDPTMIRIVAIGAHQAGQTEAAIHWAERAIDVSATEQERESARALLERFEAER